MKAWDWFSQLKKKSKFGKIAITPSFLVKIIWAPKFLYNTEISGVQSAYEATSYERVQRLTNIFVRTCWKKYLAYNGFEIQSFYATNKSRISLSLLSCIILLIFSINSYLKRAFSFKIWPKLAQIWLKEIRHLMFKCKILLFILFDDP